MWTNVSFTIMFMGTHSTAQDMGCNTEEWDTWEKLEMSCISVRKQPETVSNCSNNWKCCRLLSHTLLFTDRFFFIESNLRKPVPLLNCSNFYSPHSVSFPVYQHWGGTLVFLRACKTLSCLVDHEHKHWYFCLSWVEWGDQKLPQPFS